MVIKGFPGGSVVKNLPANAGDAGLILGQEDPLEKKMVSHSSMPARETPCTEEPDGLQFKGSQRVGHDRVTKQQRRHLPQNRMPAALRERQFS